MNYKSKTMRLAATNGCTVQVMTSGKIYLDAPDGMAFRSCNSTAIYVGGGVLPRKPSARDWKEAYSFFRSEIAEGFEKE